MRFSFLVGFVSVIAGLGSSATCSGSREDRAPPAISARAARVVSARANQDAASFSAGVVVHLEPIAPGAEVISFGVPLPAGAVSTPSTVAVEAAGATLPARVRELLAERDASGARVGAKALQVQMPASAVAAGGGDVFVRWRGKPSAEDKGAWVPLRDKAVGVESPATVETASRTIESRGGSHQLVETGRVKKTLFVGREPRVLATFPDGYISATGIVGPVSTARRAAEPKSGGLAFLSDALDGFTRSSMYLEKYPLNPHAESVIDPVADFSGWLYDRCATYLTAYAHLGKAPLLRHAHKSCSYFADSIDLSGPRAGLFRRKPEPDSKYSHARGLYAWYALTGDETARAAVLAIADMWLADENFVVPYRRGKARGPDKLWTERLLAASLEGLYFGYLIGGERKYLTAFGEIFDTAYRHLTGDAAELARINPGVPFPPQNCFIHSAEQQSEDSADKPWCSSWMSALLVEVLLVYQAQSGDPRVDEIFVRLARFLRDTGTAYFDNDVRDDSFLSPSICSRPADGENRRRLVPLYGAGRRGDGKRWHAGEWSDSEHCADATALTAAALRALRRQGKYDDKPIGPFPSEGASMLALHKELASCAQRTFTEQTRARRDPAAWTSEELAAGARDPAKFIEDNKIGYPIHVQSPQRKLSWWFNGSVLQYGLLADAGIEVRALDTGAVQPPRCP